MEIGGLERRCGACDGCGVDGVLWCVWSSLVCLGFYRERKKKKEEEEKKEETADNEKERKKDENKGLEKERVG